MDDLAFLSAVDLGALLRERSVSAPEVTEAALRRIDEQVVVAEVLVDERRLEGEGGVVREECVEVRADGLLLARGDQSLDRF